MFVLCTKLFRFLNAELRLVALWTFCRLPYMAEIQIGEGSHVLLVMQVLSSTPMSFRYCSEIFNL